MSFLVENWYLVVLALVSGGLLLWPAIRGGGNATALGPVEATQLINHRNAIVVDLRDEKDFTLGSLAGARHLPEAEVATRAADLARFKARPLLLVCGNGQRSGKALAAFREQGFAEAHTLAGGIAAWTQAGLPLVRGGRAPVVKEPVRNRKAEQRQRQKAFAASTVAPASTTSVTPADDTGATDAVPPVRVEEAS